MGGLDVADHTDNLQGWYDSLRQVLRTS